MARLTTLRKPGGGVRGIATAFFAASSRERWPKSGHRFSTTLLGHTSSRSRPVSGGMTEALAASVRAALSLRPRSVLLSLDGRSACDSVSRAAFLRKLQEVAPELLTFVRLVYGQPSSCYWWDAAGACRTMPQGEGCKHGDALAPARFALGQHETLCRATPELHQDDALLAFLDDLYVVTVAQRARAALDSVTSRRDSVRHRLQFAGSDLRAARHLRAGGSGVARGQALG